MYPAKKSNAIDENEARKIAGNNAVDEVLLECCEFTGRVIDDCFGVDEMSASVDFINDDGENCILTVLFLVDKKAAAETDDLGSLDYDDYTFTID